MDTHILVRAAAVGAFAAAALLVVQFGIGVGIGADLALLNAAPNGAQLAAFLKTQASALFNLMAADDLFVVAYTTAFVGLALYTWARSRVLAVIVLGFALLTSATDFTENSLTVALTQLALGGATPGAVPLLGLQILAQLKYLWIYVALALLAPILWQDGREGRIVTILFLLFPIIGVAGIALPSLVLLRVVWMFVLLVSGGVFLWRRG